MVCEFGLWIKTDLIKKHMTQRKLSELTDIDEKVISDIIHGRNVKQAHKEKIHSVLGSES